MHVRNAGQATPHLEHNPLSLLGACYATPGRKLNDPVQWELTLASVLDNVEDRFGCSHLAYLDVLSMGNLPHFAVGLLLYSSVPV